MSDLLPCPFCGSDAMTRLADTVPRRGVLHSWYVVCLKSSCSCHLGFYGEDEDGDCGIYETEEEAIAAWNTRYHFGLKDEDYNILLDEMGIAKPERIAHWQPTFIDGKPAATCSLCGSVEWDYDMDEPWEYCHGCGAKVVEE